MSRTAKVREMLAAFHCSLACCGRSVLYTMIQTACGERVAVVACIIVVVIRSRQHTEELKCAACVACSECLA